MKNTIKKLAVVAILLPLLGVANSYGQKKNNNEFEKITPVTHQEADDALMHFKQKARDEIQELRDRLSQHIEQRVQGEKLSRMSKESIKRDVQDIRERLRNLWDEASKSLSVEKIQDTLSQGIDKVRNRINNLSERLKSEAQD